MRFMTFMDIKTRRLNLSAPVRTVAFCFAKQGGYMFNKITLGPITIYMYGLMIAIGFASALFLCNYRGKKRGLSEDTIFGIFYVR
ncbi:MAG: prolipoprotein diacylglyceryl transferase family protein [Roseburia sp.]